MNSLLPSLSNPSAILSITDPDAALICSLNLKSFEKGSQEVNSKISFESSRAFFQMDRSSKFDIVMYLKVEDFLFEDLKMPNLKISNCRISEFSNF